MARLPWKSLVGSQKRTSTAVSSFWWKQWGKGWEKVNFVPSYTGLPSIILKDKSQVISWLKVSNDFQLHLKNLNKSKFTSAKSTLHDSYYLSNLMTQCLLVHWSPFPLQASSYVAWVSAQYHFLKDSLPDSLPQSLKCINALISYDTMKYCLMLIFLLTKMQAMQSAWA